MSNPLLTINELPEFSQIKTEHIEPAIDELLENNRSALAELLSANTIFTWENLIRHLEKNDDRLSRAWSPVSHLHSVADNNELREAYNSCLPKLTEYTTEMGQHEGLYQAYKQIAGSKGFKNLEQAQQKTIENVLRDFRLSGIDLDKFKQKKLKSLKQKLPQLQTKFEENLLDATQAWTKHIENKDKLNGLPESALALVAQNAKQKGLEGWLFNLDFPCYFPIMQYAEDREFRREIYQAFVTRASDQGPNAGKFDNSEIILEVLNLRRQIASLLGFNSYAEYSLSRKMAGTPDEVFEFLYSLSKRSKHFAQEDFNELEKFSGEFDQVDKLEAWDIAYYSEKLRQHKFDFTQEELRPYFPVTKVLQGMFTVVNILFGLSITEKQGIDAWRPDISFFQISDENGDFRGSFYLDLYAREHKRGGAWMDECIVRRKDKDKLQHPVAYLTCNFTPPVEDKPSLLTHDEVITLFHEFGHGLHHMLTLVDYAGVSGINGVSWDAVELPSQFMENWCWQSEALKLISGHHQSGEPLTKGLFDKMLQAKTFQSGMQMVRQLEFALFDFHLHHDFQGDTIQAIQKLLDNVRKQIAVIAPPAYNRFQHGFSHIFASGYAAGYYSYKWAEVLSADAFSKFEKTGIFNRQSGKKFLHSILEQGGAKEPMELFIQFRGRKPEIEPLLRHSGVLTSNDEVLE